ncbi:hypothetical protein ACPOL_6764 (plasmid) [Acidisarcina polymorpha]|uniref:Uncharacterized protein n=1 Tax=Acidisarcina polymorpha TaxID=2211140 RepID=A0A2Z5GB85_9BACT|nr:hypothetical protein ACPOL_6764 [Acidisarcina polymorpha]
MATSAVINLATSVAMLRLTAGRFIEVSPFGGDVVHLRESATAAMVDLFMRRLLLRQIG